MRKITSFLLTLVILATVFTAVPAYAASDIWGGAMVATTLSGSGTTDDPFQISNAAELRYVNDLVNSGETYVDANENTQYYYKAAYKLTADIDFENGEWIPLGQALPLSYDPNKEYSYRITRENAFEGNFDGNNYVISNIKMTHTNRDASTIPHSEYLGFFGRCNNAEIKNLGLDGMDIQWDNYDYTYNTYIATDGTTKNATERAKYIGAFAGSLAYTKVSNCYVVNSIVMNTNTGRNDTAHAGFIGSLVNDNNVTNCYAYNITLQGGMTSIESGFVGTCLDDRNRVTNCYAAEIKHNAESLHPTTYGFAYNFAESATNVMTNCYSTFGDAQGAGTSANGRSKAYSETMSLGEASVTAEALVSAMLATGAYEQKSIVNDGYPCLKVSFDGTPATSYAGGSGTKDDPRLISTPGQLLLASRQVADGSATYTYFKLLNDIDYNNQLWEPIGYSDVNGNNDFRGGFDGDGHVVRNLSIGTGNYYHCGFFGLLTGATITDLGIENFQLIRANTVTSQVRVVGGFAGQVKSIGGANARGTKITNCYIKNSSVMQTTNFGTGSESAGDRVNVDLNLGAFIGRADIRHAQSEITNCYADNIVLEAKKQGAACGFIGGITQYNNSAAVGIKIANCYASRIRNNDAGVTQFGFGFVASNTTSETFALDEEKVVVDNCYSTFANQEGTGTYAIAVENNYGIESASASAINSVIARLAGWQNGANVNSEFPALAWEIPTDAPDYMIESVAKEIALQNIENNVCTLTSDHKITVNVTRKSGVTGVANLYVAGYDIDGRLTGAQSASVNLDDFSFTADIDAKKAKTIKVFLWDNAQAPIVEAYNASTTAYDQLNEIWSPEGVEIEQPVKKTRLVLMGDSIMDNQINTSEYSWNKSGWEGYIDGYLTDDMTVIKHGHSGQTVWDFINSRTTYHKCSWDSIKTEFGQGDYVVLALGSNDNSRISAYNNGNKLYNSDGSEKKTYSVDEFKNWYRQIIREAQAKGATIILMTPKVASWTYDSSTGKFNPDKQAPLARQATIEVAQEMGVECIDMATLYANELNAMLKNNVYTYEQMIIQKDGDTVTGPGTIFVDSTHLTEYGAQIFARLFAEAIEARTTGLEEFVVIPAK